MHNKAAESLMRADSYAGKMAREKRGYEQVTVAHVQSTMPAERRADFDERLLGELVRQFCGTWENLLFTF